MTDEQTFDVNWFEKSDFFTELELIGEGAEEEAQWFLSTIRFYKNDPDRLIQTAKTLEAGMENDRLRLSQIIRLMEAPGNKQ